MHPIWFSVVAFPGSFIHCSPHCMIRLTQRFIVHHQLWVVFGKMVFEEVDSDDLFLFCVPHSPPTPPGFHICSPICAWKRQREVLFRAKGPLTAEVPGKPKNTCEVTVVFVSGSFVNSIASFSHISDSFADLVNVAGLTWMNPSFGG